MPPQPSIKAQAGRAKERFRAKGESASSPEPSSKKPVTTACVRTGSAPNKPKAAQTSVVAPKLCKSPEKTENSTTYEVMLRQALKLSETASVKVFEKAAVAVLSSLYASVSRVPKRILQKMPIITAARMCVRYKTMPMRGEANRFAPAKPIIKAGPVLPQKSRRRRASSVRSSFDACISHTVFTPTG